MRILVYGMVGTNRGGIETYLLKMDQNMSSETIFDYVIEEDVCIHSDDIKKGNGKIYFISPRKDKPIKNLVDNYNLLKKCKADIRVVYFNLSSLSWIFPILLACFLGYKVFVHSHNADFIAANNSIHYRIVNFIAKRILHLLNIKRLTCSKPASDFLFMPTDNVEMIYNAINVDRFIFDKEIREKKRYELGIDKSKFLIGFVGRLQYQKNPFYLIKIMQLFTDDSDVELIAIGDGDMRESLENQSFNMSNIHFLGNRKDVNELYQAMDILLLPSYHEGLPYVVVEAQTSGLRCIVSEYVTREVDFSGNVSFLPLETDARNWKDKIQSLRKTEIDRSSMGLIAKDSFFNIENEAKRVEMILRESC